MTLGVALLAVVGFVNSTAESLGRGARKRSSSVRAPELRDRLHRLLESERIFTDPELSLPKLAEALGESPHTLSQALNESAGEGYAALIARSRVQEAKRLLLDPANDRLTIEGIGWRSGFSSRSTFYQAFRRFVGTTPTGFRDCRRESS